MKWKVLFTRRASKQVDSLSLSIQAVLRLLVEDLTSKGPSVENWPNYSKLHGKKSEDKRHCHLQKGRPTYICCWEIINKNLKLIEVYYVGTHENAPY